MVANIRTVIAALALLAGLPLVGLGQTIIPVTNASFESPVLADEAFTDYDAEPNTIPGWTNPNIGGVQHMDTSNYAAIPDGVNVAFLDSGTGVPIAQVLSFALQPGTYDLTVAAGWRNGKTFAGGTFGLYTASGTLLGSDTLTSPAVQGTFQDETLALTILATNPNLGQDLQIELGNAMTTTGTDDFDNVRLNFTPASTPEPSTYALALGGLLALGFIGWRRNARQQVAVLRA